MLIARLCNPAPLGRTRDKPPRNLCKDACRDKQIQTQCPTHSTQHIQKTKPAIARMKRKPQNNYHVMPNATLLIKLLPHAGRQAHYASDPNIRKRDTLPVGITSCRCCCCLNICCCCKSLRARCCRRCCRCKCCKCCRL